MSLLPSAVILRRRLPLTCLVRSSFSPLRNVLKCPFGGFGDETILKLHHLNLILQCFSKLALSGEAALAAYNYYVLKLYIV